MNSKVSNIITSLVAAALLITVVSIDSGVLFSPIQKVEAAAEQTLQPAQNAVASDSQVKDGVAKLQQTAKDLREAAVAGDAAKIKTYGAALEEDWSKIEDGIKPQYPKFYVQVETFLNPAVAATQASTIDKDVIVTLDDQLIVVLNDLSQNLSGVSQIKTGASKLMDVAKDMKKAINAKDAAKVKEIGPKLEDVWSTFEDNVKPYRPDLYQEIEKNLNPEVAGAQQSVLDTKKMDQLNDNLLKVLAKLL